MTLRSENNCFLFLFATALSAKDTAVKNIWIPLKNSEYDQEIPQSQTADKPMAPRERAT